jgi:hypothetical protein
MDCLTEYLFTCSPLKQVDKYGKQVNEIFLFSTDTFSPRKVHFYSWVHTSFIFVNILLSNNSRTGHLGKFDQDWSLIRVVEEYLTIHFY